VNASALAAGFVRAAACSLPVHLADPEANAAAIAGLAQEAANRGAALAVFPELSLTGYSLDDLFMQNALLSAADRALAALARATASLPTAIVVGTPIHAGNRLYNCAAVIAAGRILGAVPKSYLPNYREFYERRQFASGVNADATARVAGQDVRVSTKQLFRISITPDASFALGVEICEDLWVPVSPAAQAALAGAEAIANLSGSPITVAKARERRALAAAQSAKLISGYVYAASGLGESSTDLSWDGQTLVFERGELLAQGPRFARTPVVTLADIDLACVRQDRLRQGTFEDNRVAHLPQAPQFAQVAAALPARETKGARRLLSQDSPDAVSVPPTATPAPAPGATGASTGTRADGIGQRTRKLEPLERDIPRFPFVPDAPDRLDQDCYEAYNIQVSALTQRLASIGEPKIVIGVSGGLDSSHALIVAAKAMDLLGRRREDILAFTLPGFGTTRRTRENAEALTRALGASFDVIDIRPAAREMLQNIGHPFAQGKPVYDVTFENVQAGLRTDYLFRLANQRGGIVLGTGDLSELALGWCTYGVGDQMSHYGVNAGVPKTLVQYLIAWVAASGQFEEPVGATLEAILGTEISPELIPPGADGAPQSTQATIGPYPLHDFVLYYTLRFGLSPREVFFRLRQAWEDPAKGLWPRGVAAADRRGYTPAELLKWLEVFYRRFFANQFKRSALPNGPKVVRGGALSPRGDWRQPSDSSSRVWLSEVEALKRELT
jgi:NAD+ synthase (glutamine-hydrolysing)